MTLKISGEIGVAKGRNSRREQSPPDPLHGEGKNWKNWLLKRREEKNTKRETGEQEIYRGAYSWVL